MVGIPQTKAVGKERHVLIEVADQTGGKVGATVWYRLGNKTHSQSFCGSTEYPIRINPRSKVGVMTDVGACLSPDGIPTTGTVSLTFTR